jgi:hypothetical protein
MVVALCCGSSDYRVGINKEGSCYALYVPTCVEIVESLLPSNDRDPARSPIDVQRLFAVASAFGSALRADPWRDAPSGGPLFGWLASDKSVSAPHIVLFKFAKPVAVQSLNTAEFHFGGLTAPRARLHYEMLWVVCTTKAWVKISGVYVLNQEGNVQKANAMPQTVPEVRFCCFELVKIETV